MRYFKPDRSRARLVCAALAAAALGTAGCTSSSDLQQLNQNEFTLRGMIASDRQQIDSLHQQIRELQGQIAEMKHGTGSPTGGGDQSASNDRINKLEAQVSALQAAGIASTPSGMAPMPSPSGVAGTPGISAMASATSPSSISPPPASAPPAEVAPTWPQELDSEISSAEGSKEQGAKTYRDGLDAMKAGKYPLAVAKFTEMSHRYPKSPLTEPAEYFAANALYETGKYDQSILQFNDLVMRYPKGRFASQALLREGQAFIKLNDPIDARLTLQKLQSDHPGTPEATAAASLMRNLASD